MAEIENSAKPQIWRSFANAVDAEFREGTAIRGISGLDHPVQAIAVDEKLNRLVVISAEPSARVAALMQLDVQATMPDTRVIVARPVIIDVGVLARRFFAGLEPRVPLARLTEITERFNAMPKEEQQAEFSRYIRKVGQPVIRGWKNASLPTANQLMDAVKQLFFILIGSKLLPESKRGPLRLKLIVRLYTT